MTLKSLYISFFACVFANIAQAGVLCQSPCVIDPIDDVMTIDMPSLKPGVPPPDTSLPGTPLPEDFTSVYVEGGLYLDYSVLPDSQSANSETLTIGAATINIFAHDQVPPLPSVFSSQYLNIGDTKFFSGNLVLFGTVPIAVGSLIASGNIFIGNYSHVAPVPAPAAAYLFISSLLAVAYRRFS